MALIEVIRRDMKTGQVIEQVIEDTTKFVNSEGIEVIHKGKINSSFTYKTGRKFSFIKDEAARELMLKLEFKDIGYLVQLSTYADYDGILLPSVRAKKPLVSWADFQKVLGMTRAEYAKAVVQRLLIAEALIEIEVELQGVRYNSYKISPNFFLRGSIPKKDRKAVTKSYSKGMRAVYSENKQASTGWLAILLPFLDKETNILIKNPAKLATEDGVPLSLQEIADNTGISKQIVAKRIREMKVVGFPVFETIITEGSKIKYKVNPLVANKMSLEVEQSAIKEFCMRGNTEDILEVLGVSVN